MPKQSGCEKDLQKTIDFLRNEVRLYADQLSATMKMLRTLEAVQAKWEAKKKGEAC